MPLTNTHREAEGVDRPVAVRDLKFAGTVAAGLVAGVLGVGALSAPLLGWSTWPERLSQDPKSSVNLATGERSPQIERDASRRGPANPVLVAPGPGGTLVFLPGGEPATVPTAGGGGTGGGTGGGATGGGVVGQGGPDRSDSGFGGTGFATPNLDDSDDDGMPDSW
ncbi:MAG: hypothetical protein ACXW08_03580, partial [Solirubrobacteraceae bacterium]